MRSFGYLKQLCVTPALLGLVGLSSITDLMSPMYNKGNLCFQVYQYSYWIDSYGWSEQPWFSDFQASFRCSDSCEKYSTIRCKSNGKWIFIAIPLFTLRQNEGYWTTTLPGGCAALSDSGYTIFFSLIRIWLMSPSW